MALLNTPEDYEALGVAPPESVVHTEADEALAQARLANDHVHQWKQRGNDIFCERGTHLHGHHIDPRHILIGTDEHGTAQFKTLDNTSLSDETDK